MTVFDDAVRGSCDGFNVWYYLFRKIFNGVLNIEHEPSRQKEM